jgi:hypothetical protein
MGLPRFIARCEMLNLWDIVDFRGEFPYETGRLEGQFFREQKSGRNQKR